MGGCVFPFPLVPLSLPLVPFALPFVPLLPFAAIVLLLAFESPKLPDPVRNGIISNQLQQLPWIELFLPNHLFADAARLTERCCCLRIVGFPFVQHLVQFFIEK